MSRIPTTCTKAVSGLLRRPFVCASIGLALAGAAASSTAAPIVIGYIPDDLSHPYNAATVQGFQKAADAAGVSLKIINPRGSIEKQSNAIDDFISQKVNAIGFLPLDSVVAVNLVDRAVEHHIPIGAIAVMVGDPQKRQIADPYENLTALATTDEIKGGEVAGTYAAKLLANRPNASGKAKIAIIEGAAGFAVVKQRTDGFKSGLDKAGASYQIVSSQPTNWTPEQGEQVCQNVVTANPDVALIFSQADDMAVGCARALSALGSEARIVSTGGGSKLGNDAIAAGEIDASVCTRPKLLGELLFKALYAAATHPQDKPKAEYVTYDLPLITKQTLGDCPENW